jgi:hypothetical protein
MEKLKSIAFAVLLAAFAFSCTPSVIDTLKQSPEEVAEWLAAGARIEKAAGIKWSPETAPCSGDGCAQKVSGFDKSTTLGDGDPTKFRARVLDEMDSELTEQVKLHELLHTMLVMHVTSQSVMNPIAKKHRDCISEAELWQLCHILEGRCTRQVPECEIESGWRIIIPGGHEVDPVAWERRIQNGKTLVELALEASETI